MTGTAEAAKPIASVASTTNGNCRILGTASKIMNAVRSIVSTVPVRDAAREMGRAVVWGAERTDIAGSWMTYGRLRQGDSGAVGNSSALRQPGSGMGLGTQPDAAAPATPAPGAPLTGGAAPGGRGGHGQVPSALTGAGEGPLPSIG